MPSFWVGRPRILVAASADEEVRVILVHAIRSNTVRNGMKRKLIDELPVKFSTFHRELLLGGRRVNGVAKDVHRNERLRYFGYQSRFVAEVSARESLQMNDSLFDSNFALLDHGRPKGGSSLFDPAA